MLQRLIDDFKESTATTVRMTSLAAAAAVGLFITTSFLCAAAFVLVLDRYGPVQACLTGAAIFFVVTLIAALSYIVRKRQMEARAAAIARAAASSAHTAFDPMMLVTGLQVARAIGIKRLLPILAIGGIALGFLASRQAASDETPAE
jgi:hypothetical protein